MIYYKARVVWMYFMQVFSIPCMRVSLILVKSKVTADFPPPSNLIVSIPLPPSIRARFPLPALLNILIFVLMRVKRKLRRKFGRSRALFQTYLSEFRWNVFLGVYWGSFNPFTSKFRKGLDLVDLEQIYSKLYSEKMHQKVKRKLRRKFGRSRALFQTYLSEFRWRNFHRNDDKFNTLMCCIADLYVVYICNLI
jgi:transposase-like protein